MVKIGNMKEIEAKIAEEIGARLEVAVKKTIDNIVDELPNRRGSSIAADLIYVKISPTEYEVRASYTWVLLNDGTGIYSEKHKGKGPGGAIVPVNVKALHFKNGILARALGFKDENIFLQKVKGITPRFFWERHFSQNRLMEIMARA